MNVYRSIRMDRDDMSGVVRIDECWRAANLSGAEASFFWVLHEGPRSFCAAPVRTAGVNDDTEVVHYAVTALVGAQK